MGYSFILKKVILLASAKISQESKTSKDTDRILADLNRYYNSSRIISETIFNIHLAAGKIPDPEFNWAISLPVLTAHHEALVATEKFLEYSDLSDKEDSIYQSSPVNNLICLVPDRIRRSKKNTLFRAND